ncbi:MAG: peptide deformylase [Thermomicrobiales bacterium]
MALLTIVMEGDPRLRQKATKIRQADDSLRRLANDMHETMDAAPGVGLAGPQVGVMRRIIVVRVPADYDETDEPDFIATLLNPELVKSSGRVVAAEGCLSIPGWVGDVPRAEHVTVKAMDLDNRQIRIKATGWRARVLQHEIDHLDGVLFLDRVEDKESLRKVEEAEDEIEELPVGA